MSWAVLLANSLTALVAANGLCRTESTIFPLLVIANPEEQCRLQGYHHGKDYNTSHFHFCHKPREG
jgi:hypothetical protein